MSAQRNRRTTRQKKMWEGLKQGDEGARLLFVFFLRLRKNERNGVRDEKLSSDACELKGEEILQKGQAAEAQVPPAKRKSTGEEPAFKKKKTASKPQAANTGTGEDTDESDGDEDGERGRGGGGTAGLPRQGSEESGSQTEVQGNRSESSIQATSSSVPTNGPARKATAKG